jgi:hypothetical protein
LYSSQRLLVWVKTESDTRNLEILFLNLLMEIFLPELEIYLHHSPDFSKFVHLLL